MCVKGREERRHVKGRGTVCVGEIGGALREERGVWSTVFLERHGVRGRGGEDHIVRQIGQSPSRRLQR